MKLDVLGKDGYVVSNHERQLADKALLKIMRIFKDSISGDIKVFIKKGPKEYKIEISIYLFNSLFRSEDSDKNIKTAFSKASNKLYTQLLKGKEKIKNRFARRGESPFEESFVDETIDDAISKVVKTKKVVLEPIDIDEAMFELEQLGHSFYIYRDSITNRVAVIYKRGDGEFGVIETE